MPPDAARAGKTTGRNRRRHASRRGRLQALLACVALLLGACGGAGGSSTPTPAIADSAAGAGPSAMPMAVPLPFPDNPDPNACGIPRPWGKDDPAWITGPYQGRLLQPNVSLYDSHARREVVGRISHGGRVRILLAQANPARDYYYVRSLDLEPAQAGWAPAPFVALDAPPPTPQGRARQSAGIAPVMGEHRGSDR